MSTQFDTDARKVLELAAVIRARPDVTATELLGVQELLELLGEEIALWNWMQAIKLLPIEVPLDVAREGDVVGEPVVAAPALPQSIRLIVPHGAIRAEVVIPRDAIKVDVHTDVHNRVETPEVHVTVAPDVVARIEPKRPTAWVIKRDRQGRIEGIAPEGD